MTGVLILSGPPGGPAPPGPWPPSGDLVCDGPAWLPTWPTVPEVVDWDAPDTTAATRVQLAVASIRERRWLGELLGATITEPRSEALDGTGTIGIAVPDDDPSLLATLLADIQTTAGHPHGEPSLIDRAVHVVVDGKVGPGYVLRGEAPVVDGHIHLSGQEASRLWLDRILGQGIRDDMLDGRGSFPGDVSWSQLGFTWTGKPGNIEWITPGPFGGRALRIRGSANDELRIQSQWSRPTGVTADRGTVRSAAFLRLPPGAAPGAQVLSTQVWQGGTRYYPRPDVDAATDPYAAYVDEWATDEERGNGWPTSPHTAAAQLPTPPYVTTVHTVVRPAADTAWTWVGGITQFRRDTLSTGVPRDLVEQVGILIRESQTRPGKASWSMPVDMLERSGVSELGVWRDEDETPLVEAIAAICERDDGPDLPWVDARWRAQVTHRRGRRRDDLTLTEVDLVADEGWTHDPGAQLSELRGLTDGGEAYWRVVSVARDTSRTDGHVIEGLARGPNGMPLLALDQWTRAQLATAAQPAETTRFVVAGDLGRRIQLGDTLRVYRISGHIRLDRWMRVMRRTIDDHADLHTLDLGADDR